MKYGAKAVQIVMRNFFNAISGVTSCLLFKGAIMKSKIWVLSVGLAISGPLLANEEMLSNGGFTKNSDSWWTSGATAKVANEEVCMAIANPGSNTWDVILGQAGVGLEKGSVYHVSFDAYASENTQFKTLIQHQGPPYTQHFATETQLVKEKKHYTYTFTQKNVNDANSEFQLQMGAQKAVTVCVDNISVTGNNYVEVKHVNPIRTNQLGFLPKADKLIFVESDSKTPLQWTLNDAQGNSIKSGMSQLFGVNKASAESIHQIDISDVTKEQQGLVVKVGTLETFPFDISTDIYSELKNDALAYFYHNRSGIEIKKEFVKRDDLARPAGHPQDVVSCFDDNDAWGNRWPGCDFSVDATGGWYDAGDHGKYVVNSGISTWTLLNLYERGKWLKELPIPFKDGSVSIPERANGVNDLLSESRWNIEFMLAMQIPEGKKVAVPVGDQSDSKKLQLTEIDASQMVFHKVADDHWTGMPLAPHQDRQQRHVGQPSTAATLNLAAIGAQCARIWNDIDDKFAKTCLTAAQNAWQAANKHSNIFAYDNFTGGGPYADFYLQDEFYWAATELYITTGEKVYADYLTNSPLYLNTPTGDLGATNDIFWQYTAPLATISLAVVPNQLGEDVIAEARNNIINTATAYQGQLKNEGYNIPYSVAGYPWGSNSNFVNRSIFLIYAYDFSNEKRYIKAAASAMDYILGANPMNISYVTGYGENAFQNPHHRFWAFSADAKSPKPAAGALSGGPNSIDMSDPIAAILKTSCTGQTCYSDQIGAWALNEITINWNAPLVWVASALDEGRLN